VIGLFPDLLPVEFRKKVEYPEAVPVLQGRDLDLAVLALIKYLTEVLKVKNIYYLYRANMLFNRRLEMTL
jgi:hypothetical protein